MERDDSFRLFTNSTSDFKLQFIFRNSTGRRGDDERKDILRRIDDRSMHQVISKVCDYLDYESLVNAEKVSPEWRQILSDDLIWY